MTKTKYQDVNLKAWLGQGAITDLGPEIAGVRLWGPRTNAQFRKTLLAWYDRAGRRLPWRTKRTVYRSWVSEIMLQQTQVQTVIPYYQNFMAQFPSIKALAAAPEEEVFKAWEGLGYYSRARNLQAAAKQVMADFNGHFPEKYADMLKLKGIGPYTAAAISSMVFQEPRAAIDGNAMRVFSRLLMINVDISSSPARRVFQAVGDYLIAPERPGDFNQAIMDLGSSYERAKAPEPDKNPVRDFNLAILTGTTLQYPVKKKKVKVQDRYLEALILENEAGEFLLQKREQTGLLRHMWLVPLFNEQEKAYEDLGPLFEEDEENEDSLLVQEAEATYELLDTEHPQVLGEVVHQFSHRRWHVRVYYAKTQVKKEELDTAMGPAVWVAPTNLKKYATSALQEKIWSLLPQKEG